MRRLGLEWMFRLIQEPGRLWKRYLLGNWIFIARVTTDRLRQHLSGKSS
jgi:UDP-N-acetyl-D-mannosaminuronic acid transferase (WecB/TagA/CpsF family)